MSALARTSTFSKLSFFISFQEIIQENRIPHQYHSHFAGWTFNFSCIWGVRSQIRKENKLVKGITQWLYRFGTVRVWTSTSSFPYDGKYSILWQVVKTCCQRALSSWKIIIFVVLKISINPKLLPSAFWHVPDMFVTSFTLWSQGTRLLSKAPKDF